MPLTPFRFKRIKSGTDKDFAQEYNRVVATVEKMAKSMLNAGLINSTGFHTRRISGAGAVAAAANDIHLAYMKADAGAATTATCFLDTDTTGDEITVSFSVTNGANINAAIPRLVDGDLIFVTEIESTWYCVTVLQASEDCACS